MATTTLTLADVPGAAPVRAEAPKPPCPPEFRGTKTYRLNAPHYRKGVYYDAGETITVTDEVPSVTWELITPKTAAPAPAAAKAPAKGRASDESI